MLNRNLDTHQNTLQHVTKCYCPEAGKLIKREIYNTKEWKIAFYIQITSFIWKYPKVLFTSCAIWITPLYWNTGTYWLISQWLKYIFVLEHVTTTAKELPAPLGHFTVADKLYISKAIPSVWLLIWSSCEVLLTTSDYPSTAC